MAYCMKPRCRTPASVVLAYSYAGQLVLLQDAEAQLPPQTYALCSSCADALRPPKGWAVRDERERPRLYATRS